MPGPPGLTTTDPSRLPVAGRRATLREMVPPSGFRQWTGTVTRPHSRATSPVGQGCQAMAPAPCSAVFAAFVSAKATPVAAAAIAVTPTTMSTVVLRIMTLLGRR